jgi:hypothetical protein
LLACFSLMYPPSRSRMLFAIAVPSILVAVMMALVLLKCRTARAIDGV